MNKEEVIEEFEKLYKFSLALIPPYLSNEGRKEITDRYEEMMNYLRENLK